MLPEEIPLASAESFYFSGNRDLEKEGIRCVSEIRKNSESKDDTLKIISTLLKLPGFIFKLIIA